jgi:hypothetical protein
MKNMSINASKKLIDKAKQLGIKAELLHNAKPGNRRYDALGSTYAPQKCIVFDGKRLSIAQAKQYIIARER